MVLPEDSKTDDNMYGWALAQTDTSEEGEKPYRELLLRYVDVCNKVLSANRQRFPYRQIWSAGEHALSGRSVVLALHDDGALARCIVAMGEASISVEMLEPSQPPCQCQTLTVYPVKLSYVLEVITEPDRYIADPSLINWDWLRD